MTMIIKTTGGCQGDMDVSDTVVMDLDGNLLEDGKPPSKEWRWHAAIYRSRPDVGGITHFHPPYAVAFAVANRVPPIVHTAGRAHLQRIELVALLPSGSEELAEAITELFADGDLRIALMREHGAICVGPDLRTAYYRTEYLEDNAKVALLASQVAALDPQSNLVLADDPAPLAEVTP
jgi:L-ribulose-5-phosphate 4-epimerase